MLLNIFILLGITVYLAVGIAMSLILWEKETLMTTLFWPIIVIYIVVKMFIADADEMAKKLKEFVEDLRD